MYNMLLKLIFSFCSGVSFYMIYIRIYEIPVSLNAFDQLLWLTCTYPVMWLSLLLYQHEENESSSLLRKVLNTQNTSNSISFISSLHVFGLILWSIEHRLHDYSVHIFFYFLMMCCFGFIVINFVLYVINMFMFRRQNNWR